MHVLYESDSFCQQTYVNVSASFMYFIMLAHTVGAYGIIISPSTDYTTFEDNASTFTFTCSGNGTVVVWTVDGHVATTSYVLNKGIYYTTSVSPDELTVSSNLTVPTTKANHNIKMISTVLDTSLSYHQSSDPVKLILQGIYII